ncbi:hypothetical protein TEA_009381 [Camellia sinensis var. sinensis]|uniref:PRONE domain-containing protein n=1 Tax=Camellia sinensis var. sinensis TaxID=542762 RepID=A0A4S4D1I8_CAMSN|nr:hypothetical protein TEA_009381 [Camellia sinensis var. sinensis]
MGSVSSDDDSDHHSERLESYSLSADVSESESSSTFSYDPQAASSSPLAVPPNFPAPLHFPVVGGRHVIIPAEKSVSARTDLSEVELMKERFSKLLLGEDMSGGGKGVCTALAVSNAITNLSASVFGELWKLEPLAPQKKLMWRREMEWLLCVSDSIVELIPSMQEFPDGGTFEVMVTQPRLDLYVNLPALKKLDAMLIIMLDGFCDSEFYYVDRGIVIANGENIEAHSSSPSSGRPSIRLEEKWWLPFPKVPPNGLSDDSRKRLQKCRERNAQIKYLRLPGQSIAVYWLIWKSQIFTWRACPRHFMPFGVVMNAIIFIVFLFLNIPDQTVIFNLLYVKSGKTCLGEILYRYITADQFSPECLLDYLDLSSEYTTLEIANRIETAIHIWRQKYLKGDLKHAKIVRSSSWGGKVKDLVVDKEKSKLLAERAETLLQNLKLRFPGLPQTALDTNKIQFNKDVGQSILESYSRVMESLAFNIMARIDDLLYVDDATKQQAASESVAMLHQGGLTGALPVPKRMSPIPLSIKLNSCDFPLRKPVFSSSKQKLERPTRTDCTENKSSLLDSLDENLERQTF